MAFAVGVAMGVQHGGSPSTYESVLKHDIPPGAFFFGIVEFQSARYRIPGLRYQGRPAVSGLTGAVGVT